jgi:hypothetical protein
MEEAFLSFLAMSIPAVCKGLVALVQGNTPDDAVMKTIGHLETLRAQEKFPNLKVPDEP